MYVKWVIFCENFPFCYASFSSFIWGNWAISNKKWNQSPPDKFYLQKTCQLEIRSFHEKNFIVQAQAGFGFLWQHEGSQQTVPLFICNLKFEFSNSSLFQTWKRISNCDEIYLYSSLNLIFLSEKFKFRINYIFRVSN